MLVRQDDESWPLNEALLEFVISYVPMLISSMMDNSAPARSIIVSMSTAVQVIRRMKIVFKIIHSFNVAELSYTILTHATRGFLRGALFFHFVDSLPVAAL